MRIRHKLAASGVTIAAVVSAVAVSGGAANAAPFPNTEIGVHGSSHCLDNSDRDQLRSADVVLHRGQ